MFTRQSLNGAVGTQVGSSDWVEIGQNRIAAFANVTEDWQPLHLDPQVGRDAGFGGTVAHGFLSLSMLSMMAYQALPEIEGQSASVNYGFDKIRFIAPVPGGTLVRGHFTLSDASPRGDNMLLRFGVSVEIDGLPKPGLTADWLILYLF